MCHHAAQAHLRVEAVRQLDELGVHHRSWIADHLDVPLRELAVAPGLWAGVSEHRSQHPQAQRAGAYLHALLDVGAHDPGGRLWTQRPFGALLLAALGAGDAEHLLLHCVGRFAQAAGEEVDPFEDGGVDPLEAVARGEVACDCLHPVPGGSLLGQQVARSARRGDLLGQVSRPRG